MKRFEDIIRDNRNVFEDAGPGIGHEQRFARKLDEAFGRNEQAVEAKKKTHRLGVGYYVKLTLSSAAMVALVLTVGLLLDNGGENRNVKKVAQSYSIHLQEKADEILGRMETLSSSVSEDLRAEITALTDLSTEGEEFERMSEQQKMDYLYRKYTAHVQSLQYIYNVIGDMPKYAQTVKE